MSPDSALIGSILEAMPAEWRGTTFNNSNLLGREGFTSNLQSLLKRKLADGETACSSEELEKLGMAEDYLRVASNVSTTLEAFLARRRGYDVSQVFSFASTTMPIVAILLTRPRGPGGEAAAVRLYLGDEPAPFNDEQRKVLALLGGKLECVPGAPPARGADHNGEVVLGVDSLEPKTGTVDAIIGPNVLYIVNTAVIPPKEILVVRKRLSTPATSPMAEAMMQKLASLPETAAVQPPPEEEVTEFDEHLQTLSGTPTDMACRPVCFTAGLSAIASLWVTLIARGGADILMASTAYGGSSQVTDVLSERSGALLRKHTFHIQGSASILPSIRAALAAMRGESGTPRPITCLFVEVPTNPDMKVPDMPSLAAMLAEDAAKAGVKPLLLVDSTFAPDSRCLASLRAACAELPVINFLSMSKSVSRGMTTAGSLIANHTPAATALLNEVRATAATLDTTAKPDQMRRLVDNHRGVEERCQRAYQVAVRAGGALCEAVEAHAGSAMALAFVSEEHAKLGFTSSTFSFNLPSPAGASAEENEGLAQRFVDLLVAHKSFKPCVSFGQDNQTVYCTVPATSTQGAIRPEDKAKQAVGGVQLVRLSFPPTIDTEAVCKHITECVVAIYAKRARKD